MAAGGPGGKTLALGGMRFAAALLVLAACGPVRRAGEWHPAPEPRARPSLDVGRRVRPAEATLACVDSPLVTSWERRMRSRRELADDRKETMARGARYLPQLRQLVADAGLPPGLALLPAVESGFEPRARGKFGELGLWQLRPATARRFGLVVDAERDDRADPAQETRAAARYLGYLHRRYRDWPLALAAYNAGEGRIDRALARQPHATFWELSASGHLPRKSRDYVPRFLALVRLDERVRACAPRPATEQLRVAAAAPPSPRPLPVVREMRAPRTIDPQATPHCDAAFARRPGSRGRAVETGIALATPPAL